MSREIGAFEAKNKLGALLDGVANVEEVVITRRGKPIARMILAERSDRTHAKAAVERIRARSAGASLGELTIKDLVNEGRP